MVAADTRAPRGILSKVVLRIKGWWPHVIRMLSHSIYFPYTFECALTMHSTVEAAISGFKAKLFGAIGPRCIPESEMAKLSARTEATALEALSIKTKVSHELQAMFHVRCGVALTAHASECRARNHHWCRIRKYPVLPLSYGKGAYCGCRCSGICMPAVWFGTHQRSYAIDLASSFLLI